MTSEEILDEIKADLVAVREERESLLARVREKDEEESRLEGLASGLRHYLLWRRKGPIEAKNVGGPQPLDGRQVDLPLPTRRGVLDLAATALGEQPRGEGLDTHGLIAAMEKHGFASDAQNVYLSVFGALNRAAKRPGGPIVKVDRRWALREWYPDGVPVQDDDDEQE